MDFQSFQALTFDCYGTLVDWETGILDTVGPLLSRHGVSLPGTEILGIYATLESEAEKGSWVPYRTVLRRVVEGFGRELGFRPNDRELDSLARSLGDWPVFPDTVRALEALAGRYRLAVVSNVDEDLFARTREQIGVDFAAVVTADQVCSYKPAPRHFEEALARLGLGRDQLLHVAQSLHHDIAPANRMGLSTVWVTRRGGAGATPAAEAHPDLTVPDLRTLVEKVGLEASGH